jgi:putative nucleotidyltransferase with HDIG domain
MDKSKIRDVIVSKVENFKVPPDIILRLLTVIQDASHTISNVVDTIQSDPSLTARVLRVANTSAFCRRGSINTLSRAIIQMGERTVTEIAFDICMDHVFGNPLTGYNCTTSDFWAHSLMTAIAAREISQQAKGEIPPDIAYTAGLLHDIGKAVISEFIVGNMPMVHEWFDKGKVHDFIDVEKQLINTDHAEVGGMMAEKWKFPEVLQTVIRHHHYPSNTEDNYKDIVFCVHLGDMVAMIAGKGTGVDAFAYELDGNYVEYINLGKGDLQSILLKIQDEFAQKMESIMAIEES